MTPALGDVITDVEQLKTLADGTLLADLDFRYLICSGGLVVDDGCLVRRFEDLYLAKQPIHAIRIVYLPEQP